MSGAKFDCRFWIVMDGAATTAARVLQVPMQQLIISTQSQNLELQPTLPCW